MDAAALRTCSLQTFSAYRWRGLAVAAALIAGWLTCLTLGLSVELGGRGLFALLLLPLMVELQTGLFITAHDAMHGLVAPGRARLNAAVGRLAVLLYALFSYDRLLTRHRQHHQAPASAEDPDYHAPSAGTFGRWYLRFLSHYVTGWQLVGMALAFNVLQHLVRVPVENLLAFWVGPALLSTLQLFYFGTYLPHREPQAGYRDEHRAQSNDFPPWLSLLTCYHFGYHHEHHRASHVPWWRLPMARRALAASDGAGR